MLKKIVQRFSSSPPDISIVVVAYNMARELPRTLHSLSRNYQLHCAELDYEVIVVDNGSSEPVCAQEVKRHGAEFQLLRIDNASASPAAALNWGAKHARGRNLGLVIDGARMVTPGVLHWTAAAFRQRARTLVSTLGFHLGPDLQRVSSQRGYTQLKEDELLRRIRWPNDGYRLFEIASLASSSVSGWSGPMAESNCLFLPATLFAELGGVEERFDSPGGGLVNLDFYKRACEADQVELIYLVGEGSFHQVHGGVTTGGTLSPALKFDNMQAEYESIRGEAYRVPQAQPILLGRSRIGANWLWVEGANNIVNAYKLVELRQQHAHAISYPTDTAAGDA